MTENVMAQPATFPIRNLMLETSGRMLPLDKGDISDVILTEVSTPDAAMVRAYGTASQFTVHYKYLDYDPLDYTDSYRQAEALFTLTPDGRYEIGERYSGHGPFIPVGDTDDWTNYAVQALNALRWNLRIEDGDLAAMLVDSWRLDDDWSGLSIPLFSDRMEEGMQPRIAIEPSESEMWLNTEYKLTSRSKADPASDPLNSRPYRGRHIPNDIYLHLNLNGACILEFRQHWLLPNDGIRRSTLKSSGHWEEDNDLLVLYLESSHRKITLRYTIEGNKLTLAAQRYEELE